MQMFGKCQTSVEAAMAPKTKRGALKEIGEPCQQYVDVCKYRIINSGAPHSIE